MLRLVIETVLGVALVLGVWRLGDSPPGNSALSPSGTADIGQHAVVRTIPVRQYWLPQDDAGPALLALDGADHLWFGELKANKLARLDTRSGQTQEWTPRDGRNNLYTTAVGPDGSVWFTEQEASYIGRFNPTTQQFTSYPLGGDSKGTSSSAGPQAVALDRKGNVWFTEVNTGRIGRLDPQTGKLQGWDVPSLPGGSASNHPGLTIPFDLVLAPDGGVWFSEVAGGAIGRLDPATGHIRLFSLSDPLAQVFALALDPTGRVWFTELTSGRIGLLDPTTGRISTIPVPKLVGDPTGLYDVIVAPDGAVWCASVGANAIVRYQPGQEAFTLFPLPTSESTPYGLALDHSGTLWFSSDAPTPQYIGALAKSDYT